MFHPHFFEQPDVHLSQVPGLKKRKRKDEDKFETDWAIYFRFPSWQKKKKNEWIFFFSGDLPYDIA